MQRKMHFSSWLRMQSPSLKILRVLMNKEKDGRSITHKAGPMLPSRIPLAPEDGSGSTYNYIYSKPFGGPGGNSSPQGIIGSYNFSSAQQGALQNFVNAVNAKTFDAQAFVSALQGLVSVFSVK